jgi:hypothetical protein
LSTTKEVKTVRKLHLPSPALVVASIALGVALTGTAVAAGVVPLAKRALNADNAKHALVADAAKKLGPQSTAALVNQAVSQAVEQAVPKAVEQAVPKAVEQASLAPGPASTAAGLVVVKTATWSLNPSSSGDFTVMCDPGQKAIASGWEDPQGYGHEWDNRPTPDGSGFKIYVTLSSTAPSTQSGTIYAVCLK